MGLTFNPFTGTLDFTGSGGGGGGTIGGTIAAPQVAFGTGADTIGGDANLIYDTTTYATPVLQQLASVLVIGNTAAGLGAAPDQPWGLYVGNGTYACGANAGCPSIQFEQNLTDGVPTSPWESDIEFTSPNDLNLVGMHAFYLGLKGTKNYSTDAAYLPISDVLAVPAISTTGVVDQVGAFATSGAIRAGSTVGQYFGVFAGNVNVDATATATTVYSFYAADQLSPFGIRATNFYPLWVDSDGVYRIRQDNTFNSKYQAIPALYNPQFTKYTPGAANYERIVQQWESNVATVTTEAGGTGTLRALNLGDSGVQVQVNGKNLTLAGNFATSGAFAVTQTYTNTTTVTFPTSGTLLTTAGAGTSLTFPGTLSIASGKTLTASNTLTFTGTDTTSFAFPSGSDTVVVLAATQTLTNKRITKRVVTATDATSITPNTDSADITYQANTQAVSGTLTINADSGAPTNGQAWLLKVRSTNAQTFAWNGVYVGGAIPLPTVTSGGTLIDSFAFIYDTVHSVWEYTGSAVGF